MGAPDVKMVVAYRRREYMALTPVIQEVRTILRVGYSPRRVKKWKQRVGPEFLIKFSSGPRNMT